MKSQSILEREKSIILVVDDEQDIRTQLKWALTDEYRVLEAQNAEESIEILKKKNQIW